MLFEWLQMLILVYYKAPNEAQLDPNLNFNVIKYLCLFLRKVAYSKTFNKQMDSASSLREAKDFNAFFHPTTFYTPAHHLQIAEKKIKMKTQ